MSTEGADNVVVCREYCLYSSNLDRSMMKPESERDKFSSYKAEVDHLSLFCVHLVFKLHQHQHQVYQVQPEFKDQDRFSDVNG